MRLFVRTPTRKVIVVDVQPTNTVHELKQLIEAQEGLLWNSFRIFRDVDYSMQSLEDTRTVEEYELATHEVQILPLHTIHLKVKCMIPGNPGPVEFELETDTSELIEELKEKI